MVSGGFLVVAAVEREILPLRELLGEPLARLVDLRVTGVGKSNSAAETASALKEIRPSRVIQIGCAGAFPAGPSRRGDVAIASEEVFADEGVETPGGFLDLQDLGLPLARRGETTIYNRVPAQPLEPGLLREIAERFSPDFRVLTGRFITVSSGSGSDERARILERRWRPLAESMEGAAAALACWKEGVPFHEIRGISNLVGARHRAEWDVHGACRNAARVAKACLEALSNP